MNNGVNMLLI